MSSGEPDVVSWDGADDPKNPKNWPAKRKWLAVVSVSTFTFLSASASSIVAPAETAIAKDLGIRSSFQDNIIFSVFLLGYVVGPILLAPLSEIYGRAIVLRLSNLFFCAFCLGCGFAKTPGQLIAFRLLAGIGACAPQTVGGGVLSDCFTSDERGKAVAMYSLAPVLGPSIAPLAGGFIVPGIGWRWCFWVVAAISVPVQICLWLGLPETYPSRLLTLKARKLRKQHETDKYKSQWETEHEGIGATVMSALVRPIILLLTQPIMAFLALYQALVYGIIFLMLSTFPKAWTEQYHESVRIGGLNYLAIAIGMSAGAQVGGHLLDRSYKYLKGRYKESDGIPEYRIPLLFPGTLLISAGLLLFGWTAEYRVFWLVPDIGAAIFAFGAFATFAIPQSYILDTYPQFAASAIGATAIARSLAGFGFPLFADAMFDAIGYGWGNSILALAAICIGWSGAAGLWFYGQQLRNASPYARG